MLNTAYSREGACDFWTEEAAAAATGAAHHVGAATMCCCFLEGHGNVHAGPTAGADAQGQWGVQLLLLQEAGELAELC